MGRIIVLVAVLGLASTARADALPACGTGFRYVPHPAPPGAGGRMHYGGCELAPSALAACGAAVFVVLGGLGIWATRRRAAATRRGD